MPSGEDHSHQHTDNGQFGIFAVFNEKDTSNSPTTTKHPGLIQLVKEPEKTRKESLRNSCKQEKKLQRLSYYPE